MEISENVVRSVKKLGSESFENEKLRDVKMSFDTEEGGEICIKVSLFFDPSTTSEDFGGGRLLKFLFNVGKICSGEYGNILPWLDLHEAGESA